jgi:hypothetical protein
MGYSATHFSKLREERLEVGDHGFFARDTGSREGAKPRSPDEWDNSCHTLIVSGSSLFFVGNGLFEFSVSSPCALCLCGGSQ